MFLNPWVIAGIVWFVLAVIVLLIFLGLAKAGKADDRFIEQHWK
jgi:hypothetical protein